MRTQVRHRWPHREHGHERRKRGIRVEPDEQYPGMWRVVLPDGSRSDMLNLSRANDYARTILAERAKAEPPETPPVAELA